MAEIGQMLRDPSTDTDEIINVLRRDAAMVARILRVANSAAFARAEPIGSIEEAVLTIGFAEVHRVVGAIAASYEALNDTALAKADIARIIENPAAVKESYLQELAKAVEARNALRQKLYGQAKQELFEVICELYKAQREAFNYYMSNLPELELKLRSGEEKARAIAAEVLGRVRSKLGFIS